MKKKSHGDCFCFLTNGIDMCLPNSKCSKSKENVMGMSTAMVAQFVSEVFGEVVISNVIVSEDKSLTADIMLSSGDKGEILLEMIGDKWMWVCTVGDIEESGFVETEYTDYITHHYLCLCLQDKIEVKEVVGMMPTCDICVKPMIGGIGHKLCHECNCLLKEELAKV